MQRDLSPHSLSEGSQSDKRITAFTAIKQDYGFQIKVAGCVCLRPARNGAENVIGIVELDDQVVPVLDARKQAATATISDFSCIVLFENVVGQTTIVTGRLFDNACQVFNLIVECMDEPETHDHLYTLSEHHLVSDTVH